MCVVVAVGARVRGHSRVGLWVCEGGSTAMWGSRRLAGWLVACLPGWLAAWLAVYFTRGELVAARPSAELGLGLGRAPDSPGSNAGCAQLPDCVLTSRPPPARPHGHAASAGLAAAGQQAVERGAAHG